MGEKKQNKNEGEKKNDGKGGAKKEDSGPITVVFNVDLHCKGCRSKVVKCLKDLDGVTNAEADSDTNKVTVIGKVDPSMLLEKLEQKTKKKEDKKNDDGGGDKKAEKKQDKKPNKVTVIGKVDPSMLREKLEQKTKKVEPLSPAPKKDKKNDDGGGDKKAEKKQDKKPKEVTTAVLKIDLKIDLRCAGCIDNIVSKTKGVESKSIDQQKNLVTVTGMMDVKALVESLKDKLKRSVEIVPPKKDAGGGGGGKKKAKDGDKKADGGGKKEERVKAEENYFTAGRGQFYPAHPAQKFALAFYFSFTKT